MCHRHQRGRPLRVTRGANAPWGQRRCRASQYFAQGHYFVLARRSPFQHLVYPMPVPGGLGVHLTLDLGGQARFGPDVAWVDDVSYAFDEGRAPAFYRAIRSYYPALADGDSSPGTSAFVRRSCPRGGRPLTSCFRGPKATELRGF